MKLNAIVITDDVAEDIGEFCVMLTNSTNQILEHFGRTRNGIQINNATYCHDTVNKHNLSEKASLVNSKSFLCFWYGHGTDTSFRMNGEDIVNTTENIIAKTNCTHF